MASFGSSVINKSSKKLAPKVPTQRRRATDQLPRYTSSQTPDAVDLEPTTQLQSELSNRDAHLRNSHAPTVQNEQLASRASAGIGGRTSKRRRVEFATEEPRAQEVPRQQEPDHVELRLLSELAAARGVEGDLEEAAPLALPRTRSRTSGISVAVVVPTDSTSKQAGKAKARGNGRQETTSRLATAAAEEIRSQVASRTRSQRAARRRGTGIDGEISSATEGASVSLRPRRRRETSEAESGSPTDGADEEGEAEGTEQNPKRKKKGRKRAVTPPDAEDHQIDPSSVRMSDLGADSRRGKKSRLEAAFQNIDWGEVVRKRKEAEAASLAAGTADALPDPSSIIDVDARLDAADQAATASQGRGPQLKLVNGEMVIDNSSLTIDRHAEATANSTLLPEEEANNLTVRVNTRSWIYDNRRDHSERHRLSNKSDPWTADQTSAFYDALRMFGTDFYIISKMFPGKSRRHIKLKFVREERANPVGIKDALVGGAVPMDMARYCEATGREDEFYKDPKAIDEDLKREEQEQLVEIERQREETARVARERKEEARKAKEEKAARGRGKKAKEAKGKKGLLAESQNAAESTELPDLQEAVEVVEAAA